MSVTREELYEQVWAEPMLAVAARHEVSSSFLARVCRRLNVPTPARGYWAKRAAGKAPPLPPLPAPGPTDELAWYRPDEPRPMRTPVPAPLPFTPGRENSSDRPPGTRSALLTGAKEHFLAGVTTEHGYLRPRKHRIVDIYVSRDTLERALNTAAALFEALEKRGHRACFAPAYRGYDRWPVNERPAKRSDQYIARAWSGPDRPTLVFIGTVAIGLSIYELSEVVPMRHANGEWVRVVERPAVAQTRSYASNDWIFDRDVPSGKLCLRATSPYPGTKWERKWDEAAPGDLAGRIPGILGQLEAAAPEIAKLATEAAEKVERDRVRWEEQRKEQERRWEEQRPAENTKRSREDLFAIIREWDVAKQVEGFFEDIDRRAAELPDQTRETLLYRVKRGRELLRGVDARKYFRGWLDPEEL